jgi:hypothetical protein
LCKRLHDKGFFPSHNSSLPQSRSEHQWALWSLITSLLSWSSAFPRKTYIHLS